MKEWGATRSPVQRPAPPPNPYAPPPRPGGRAGKAPGAGPRWWSGWWPGLPGRGRRLPRLPAARPVLLASAALAAVGLAAALAGGFGYRDLATVPFPESGPSPAGAAGRQARDKTASARALERLIEAQRPRGTYIAVDTMENRLYLKRGEEVLREAICSTGTGGVLEDPASGRRWVFETPLGTHRVRSKVEEPVWNKPDWAFIEEGQPIPRDPAERMDTFSLGDYALYLGDGYLIHGTLYQRLLGRSVTHGCVRLGDEDLEVVYRAAPVGTRVYIY